MNQQEIKFGPLPLEQIDFLPWEVVARWETELDAIVECWQRRQNRRMSIEQGAKRMGIAKSTLSKYLNGYLGMSPDRQKAFERVVGNRGMTQYAAHSTGLTLAVRELTAAEKQAKRIHEMEAELARLRGEEHSYAEVG